MALPVVTWLVAAASTVWLLIKRQGRIAIFRTFQINAWLLHLIGDILSLGKMKSLKDLPNAISWSYGIGWLSWLVMGTPFRKSISEPLEKGYNEIYTPELLPRADAIRAFYAGLLTPEELEKELKQQGFDTDRIKALIVIAQSKFTESAMKTLWNERLMLDEDILYEFVLKGYNPERTEYLTYLVEHDREIKLRYKILDAVTDLYINGGATEKDLWAYLITYEFTEEEALLHMDLANIKKAIKGNPTVAEIRKAHKLGYIDTPTAKSMLLDRGYTDFWPEVVLDIEKK